MPTGSSNASRGLRCEVAGRSAPGSFAAECVGVSPDRPKRSIGCFAVDSMADCWWPGSVDGSVSRRLGRSRAVAGRSPVDQRGATGRTASQGTASAPRSVRTTSRARRTGCRQRRAARLPAARMIRLPAAAFASRPQPRICHSISVALPFRIDVRHLLFPGRRNQPLQPPEFRLADVFGLQETEDDLVECAVEDPVQHAARSPDRGRRSARRQTFAPRPGAGPAPSRP